MTRCLFVLAALALPFFALAENAAVERILSRYEKARPTEAELGMYRLDWEESLDRALKRSIAENRPICLIIIHAKYGDITSGHC